jgi:hypothetical protein
MGEVHSFLMLKQVVHKVTTLLYMVNNINMGNTLQYH